MKRFTVVSVLVAAALFFMSGCATTYQPEGYAGGYDDTQLGPRKYVVSFNGNGFTSADQVRKYWLLRCAEIARSEGYSHFVLISGDRRSNTSQIELGQDRATVRPDGFGGANVTYQEAQEVPVTKHAAEGLIYLANPDDLSPEMQSAAIDANWYWNEHKPN